MLEYITNFFTRLLAYSGDLTEGPFWCKFYIFAKCATKRRRYVAMATPIAIKPQSYEFFIFI